MTSIKYRGPVTTRALKLAQLQVPIAAGSDPAVTEFDVSDPSPANGADLEGDNVHVMFPEIDTPCEHPDAPAGQCHFNAVSLEPTRCLYCEKKTG